jgi:predicted DNA-binding transcriptional regulator AlpA
MTLDPELDDDIDQEVQQALDIGAGELPAARALFHQEHQLLERKLTAAGVNACNLPRVWDRIEFMDRRLTAGEVVRLIGCHRATLFRWRRQGKFPERHPFGGWRQSDIERWLRLQRTSNSSRTPDRNPIAARCPGITSTSLGKTAHSEYEGHING